MPAAFPTFAFLDVGGPEILMILLVALLLFGSQRLPDLARNLGKSMREFKKATSGLEEELRRAMETPPPPPQPRAPAIIPPAPQNPPHDAAPAPETAGSPGREDVGSAGPDDHLQP
jgi:TatA/E family protein of Tat protein translocase